MQVSCPLSGTLYFFFTTLAGGLAVCFIFSTIFCELVYKLRYSGGIERALRVWPKLWICLAYSILVTIGIEWSCLVVLYNLCLFLGYQVERFRDNYFLPFSHFYIEYF